MVTSSLDIVSQQQNKLVCSCNVFFFEQSGNVADRICMQEVLPSLIKPQELHSVVVLCQNRHLKREVHIKAANHIPLASHITYSSVKKTLQNDKWQFFSFQSWELFFSIIAGTLSKNTVGKTECLTWFLKSASTQITIPGRRHHKRRSLQCQTKTVRQFAKTSFATDMLQTRMLWQSDKCQYFWFHSWEMSCLTS